MPYQRFKIIEKLFNRRSDSSRHAFEQYWYLIMLSGNFQLVLKCFHLPWTMNDDIAYSLNKNPFILLEIEIRDVMLRDIFPLRLNMLDPSIFEYFFCSPQLFWPVLCFSESCFNFITRLTSSKAMNVIYRTALIGEKLVSYGDMVRAADYERNSKYVFFVVEHFNVIFLYKLWTQSLNEISCNHIKRSIFQ